MNCQEFEELSGAYALGAVTPEERQAAEAHLADCPECRQLLQELQSVVDLLPLTSPSIKPPLALKERVLAPIRADAARQAAATFQQKSQRPRRLHWSTQLIAAAAVILLLLLGGMTAWNVSLHQQLAQVSGTTQPTTTYTIHGIAQNGDASGELIYLPHLHLTALIVHGLPTLNGTQVYQGWLLQGQHPTSIGLLNEQNGTATLNFQGNVSGYDTVAISVESGPQASKDAPKGKVVAAGPLKNPHQQANMQAGREG